MKYLKHIILVLLIFFIGSSTIVLFSQDQKPTRQSAMAAFSGGNYEKAYFEFTELLKTYSKDPLYRYYSAVSLIKLEQNPSEALKLIQDAIGSNTAARPLPSDAVFYLGRARHLSGIYHEAIEAYNKYSDQIGRKAAKVSGIPDLIQQCIQKEGAVADAAAVTPESSWKEEEESVDIAPPAVSKADNSVISDDALLVKEELPGEYSVILDEALDFQFLADSVSALLAELKKQLVSLPAEKRPAARAKITGYEVLAASHQKSADEKYHEAQTAMNPANKESDDVSGMPVPVYRADESAADQPDTLAQEPLPVTDTVDIFYYFQVLDKPVTDPGVKIMIDPEVPQGLVYRIQVAVFRNPVAPVFFKGITPVYGFKNEGSDLKTYYAGMFRNMSDARNALAAIREKGFKDSFIVSFMGRKPVSPDRAAVLEKEWGSKPFERVVNAKQVVVPADSVIPTLTFRVEIMRVAKPVKADVIESMNTLAGGRGLDIITMEDKKIAYMIGNFITFESAAEYADLIVRNGYRDARVVAWLGTKEIPLETAKQLFENLK
jgi:tetratricopeptide (TPR) repeat protein